MPNKSQIAVSAASVTAAFSAIMAMNSQEQVFDQVPSVTPFDAEAAAALQTSRSKALLSTHRSSTTATLLLDKNFLDMAYAEVADDSSDPYSYAEWVLATGNFSADDYLDYLDQYDSEDDADDGSSDTTDDTSTVDENEYGGSSTDHLIDSTLSETLSCYSNCHSACHGSRGWR